MGVQAALYGQTESYDQHSSLDRVGKYSNSFKDIRNNFHLYIIKRQQISILLKDTNWYCFFESVRRVTNLLFSIIEGWNQASSSKASSSQSSTENVAQELASANVPYIKPEIKERPIYDEQRESSVTMSSEQEFQTQQKSNGTADHSACTKCSGQYPIWKPSN